MHNPNIGLQQLHRQGLQIVVANEERPVLGMLREVTRWLLVSQGTETQHSAGVGDREPSADVAPRIDPGTQSRRRQGPLGHA